MATYYIATLLNNGDDAHDGSALSPWLTLHHACDTATTVDDVIHVTAGTYVETLQCDLRVGVSIEGEGVVSHIISTVHGLYYSDNASIVLASGSEDTKGDQSISYLKLDGDSQDGWFAIKVIKRSNVQIHNCEIVDFQIGGVMFRGADMYTEPGDYAVDNEIHDCSIINCTAEDWWTNDEPDLGAGIIQIGGQDGMLIYNNTLSSVDRAEGHNGCIMQSSWYNRGIKFHDNQCYKPNYDGVMWNFHLELTVCRGGFEIYDNEFYGGDITIDLAGTDDGNYKETYDYTYYIHDNLFTFNLVPPMDAYSSKIGIDIEGKWNEHIWIKRNHFNYITHPLQIDEGSEFSEAYYIWFENNIMENCGMGYATSDDTIYIRRDEYDTGGVYGIIRYLYFYNNVMTPAPGNDTSAFYISNLGTIKDVEIVNNTFISQDGGYRSNDRWTPPQKSWLGIDNESGTFDGLVISHNCLYDNVTNTPAILGSILNYAGVTDTVATDPLFVSASDFHLQAASPCVNAGVNVGIATDYDGVAVSDPPEIGPYEYVLPAIPVTAVTVTGTGGATTISVDNGTLQMIAHIDPHNATNQTVVWSVTNGTGSATISPSGLLTAVTNGTVTVKATANG